MEKLMIWAGIKTPLERCQRRVQRDRNGASGGIPVADDGGDVGLRKERLESEVYVDRQDAQSERDRGLRTACPLAGSSC